MKKYKAKCEMKNGNLVTLRFAESSKEDVKNKIYNNYDVECILSIDEVNKVKQEKVDFYSSLDRSCYPYIKNNNGKSVRIYT